MSLTATPTAPTFTARQGWTAAALFLGVVILWMLFGVWPSWLEWLLIGKKTFVSAILNGVTLAGLYFLVASGFTLVFGLMRNVNLAHGSLFLLGAYIGYEVSQRTGVWILGVLVGFLALAIVGLLMQIFIFCRLEGGE